MTGLLVGAVLSGAAGCTSVVTGQGRAAPDLAVSGPSTSAETIPTGAPTDAAPATRSSLAADVVADECLLDALGFSALLGTPVLPPEQSEVTRDDGSSSSSCVAESARSAAPLAAVNVYEPRIGTPAEFVRAGTPRGRRDLPGVGEAAVLVDTAPGVTLQLAGSRYVVTIAVLDGAPPDDTWRAAATAALATLPP